MKKLLALILLQLVSFCIVAQGQTQNDWDEGWNWIIPLKTQKAEVEKVFGESIDTDKTHPFQTYNTEFGKITVTYNSKKRLIETCSCVLDAGTVLRVFISPSRIIKLSELNVDLKSFKKDDTYSPREIHYSSENKGFLIATKIIEIDGNDTEVVFALLYERAVSLCAAARCQTQNEWDKGWSWIIPLKTNKTEIEKAFGESITKDKTSSFQTYKTEFGKVNVAYASKGEFVEECSCGLEAGTIWSVFISPSRIIKLSELNVDLKSFKKDDTYSPREIQYSSQKKGLLIATKIIEIDGNDTEVVFALLYERTVSLCATARCECKTQKNTNSTRTVH